MNLRILSFLLLAASAQAQPATTPAEAVPAIAFTPAVSKNMTPDDRLILERFIGHAVDFAQKLDEAKLKTKVVEDGPEAFCWVEFRYLNCLNIAYELTDDTQYLDLFRDSFVKFRNIMTTGTDDYLGWYGKPIKPRQLADQPDLLIDEVQMNFRAIGILSTWIELAHRDPEYATANEATIQSYLDLMQQHLFPKWDARDGHFATIPGRGGAYVGLDFPSPIRTTLSFEKLSIMVDGLLRLNRVSDNPAYLKRALQIGAWYKSNLALTEDCYSWMSWVPAGTWDISPDKPDSWKIGWMAPDPNAAWYVTSLSIALDLYQHGLLFDDADLARFINTQKVRCWNGDMETPEYRNTAGETSKWIKGRFLSYQLANYDATLAKLAFNGPHEAQALADSTKSWQGGCNAQDYVTAKFLNRPTIKTDPKPYASIGQKFLATDANLPFYQILNKPVIAPGAIPPTRPSDYYALPTK